MRKIIGTLLISGAAALVVGISVIYSGVYDVSALTPHSKPATWLMNSTMHASVERRAKEIEVPQLTQAMKQSGINDFEAMCVSCHGRPGRQPDAMGLGLNPKAPDLAMSGVQLSAAELYWITKNGIKMTGMPAWGASHKDADLWPVVAFLTELPHLDPTSYAANLADASGSGHHATGSSAMQGAETQAATIQEQDPHAAHKVPVEPKPAHDHTSHDH